MIINLILDRGALLGGVMPERSVYAPLRKWPDDWLVRNCHALRCSRTLSKTLFGLPFSKPKRILPGTEPANRADACPFRREEEHPCLVRLVRTFLKCALPTMYGTLLAVAVTTGLRPSEYIGLKWQDIDWERGTVSVKRTLRKGPTGQWEYGETKRAGSRRIIRLQNWILSKLKDLKQSQTENPVVDPEEWPEAVDLIFVMEFGRPVNVNSLVYKHFKPILKRSGLPNIRLYDLRHTAATLALTVGVSPKVVSEQLGHERSFYSRCVFARLASNAGRCGSKVEAALFENND